MQDNCESDPVRAREIAELADRMIADGYPPHEVVELWKDNGGIFPAIAARMIRYPVIFQIGGWDQCDEEADDLMFLYSFAQKLPPEIRDAYDQERRVGAEACRVALERIRCEKFKSERHFEWRLNEAPWIVPRVYQEDFFLSVGETTKWAMVNNLWKLPRTVRVLFVTQIMLSKAVPREWRERVYCKVFPSDHVDGRQVQREDPRMSVEVFGRQVWVQGTWSGYNRPYRLSYGDEHNWKAKECSDYYPFAVNVRIQEVYAESELVRELYVSAKLRDYEVVAATLFYRDAPHDERLEKFLHANYDRSSIETFLMMCDMTGVEFSRDLLRLLVKHDMVELLAVYLTDRRDEVEREMSFSEVLFHAITHLPKCRFTELVTQVARASPESVANAEDPFGNNLLWYLLSRDVCCWDQDSVDWLRYADGPGEAEELEDALVSAGCDPEHENHLGISYAAMQRRRGVLYA